MALSLASALEECRPTAVTATVVPASEQRQKPLIPERQGQLSTRDGRMNRSKAGSLKSDGRCDFFKNTSQHNPWRLSFEV